MEHRFCFILVVVTVFCRNVISVPSESQWQESRQYEDSLSLESTAAEDTEAETTLSPRGRSRNRGNFVNHFENFRRRPPQFRPQTSDVKMIEEVDPEMPALMAPHNVQSFIPSNGYHHRHTHQQQRNSSSPIVKTVENYHHQASFTYPVVAGESSWKKSAPVPNNPPNRSENNQSLSAAPLVRIVPINAVSSFSAPMMPFVAGDLLANAPQTAIVSSDRQTMPVVAGSQPAVISEPTQHDRIAIAKSSKKMPMIDFVSRPAPILNNQQQHFYPVQPATLPTVEHLMLTTTTARTKIAAFLPQNKSPVSHILDGGPESPPIAMTPTDFVPADEGTIPELLAMPSRMGPSFNRFDNRNLYSCNGKRFVATEKEAVDVRCCRLKPYKWTRLICSGGDLFDPTMLPSPTTKQRTTSTIPTTVTTTGAPLTTTNDFFLRRQRTRPSYVDFVNNHQQASKQEHAPQRVRRPLPSNEQQQGIPFIQPDALPGAMLAAYYKKQSTSTPTTSTVMTTTSTLPTTTTTTTTATSTTTTELPTTMMTTIDVERPILLEPNFPDFEAHNFGVPKRFNPDPNQLQIDPPLTEDSSSLEQQRKQEISYNDYEVKVPEVVAFDKNSDKIPKDLYVDGAEGQPNHLSFEDTEPTEDGFASPDVLLETTTEESVSATEFLPSDIVTTQPTSFAGAITTNAPETMTTTEEATATAMTSRSLLGPSSNSRVVLVRCHRQDWPISEPIGTYICCGDMLHYTLLDTVTCNDEIHPPLIIDEEHHNRVQQLFDFSSMVGLQIAPSATSLALKRRNLVEHPDYHEHDQLDDVSKAPQSICDTASSQKFCCGETLYEKEFGQICCNGVYGFSRAGLINCCGSQLFDVRTHECSESGTVVDRKKRTISYFY